MTSPENKIRLSQWFISLQKKICQNFEAIETDHHHPHIPSGRFRFQPWNRHEEGGGGTMAIMHGAVFEKVGVNVSTVWGKFLPEFCKEIPGTENSPDFWATGLSLVAHPLNPHIPTVHFNTRHIVTGKSWFGGGGDLTPTFPFEEDTKDFHSAFQEACDAYAIDAYGKFSKWCDDYFYLPHRKEPRGVGGIFYDGLNSGDFEHDFKFTRDVGEAFLRIYPKIVTRRLDYTWSSTDKHQQLIKRGKYVEFNLLYDRGTRFGLQTNGNIEAIFMSLPPLASWA